MHAAYLIQDERPDPFASVPEFSRRARGFTVWAALRLARPSGRRRDGRAVLRPGPASSPTGCSAMDGVEVLNDVVFTQVCARSGPTRSPARWPADCSPTGTAWMTPSTWHGQAVLRISVSNWRTSEADVDRTLAAVRRVLAEVRAD